MAIRIGLRGRQFRRMQAPKNRRTQNNSPQNKVTSALTSKFKGMGGLNMIAASVGLGILCFDIIQLIKNCTSMFYAQDLSHAYDKDKTHKLTKSNLDCLKGLFTAKSIVDAVGVVVEAAAFLGLGPKLGAVTVAGIYFFTEFIKKKILDEDKKDPAIIMEAQLNSPDGNQQTPQQPTPPSQDTPDPNAQNNTSNKNGDDDTNKKDQTGAGKGNGGGNGGGNGQPPYGNGGGLTGAGNGTQGGGYGSGTPNGQSGGGGTTIYISPSFAPVMNPYNPITRTG